MHQGEDVAAPQAAPEPLRAETFEPFVGRSVRFAGTDVEFVLDSVLREGGTCPDHVARAPFTLIFSGPRGGTHLSEGLYRCAFGGSGDDTMFDIHVAPVHTAAPDRQDYQAVFN